jgi:aspartate aminotransferase
VPVPLDPARGYQYDIAAIDTAVTARTKAIFVNTPHNPTGAVASRETLTSLADLAARHDLLLLSDEAYEHVLFDGLAHVSLGSLPAAHGRTISVYSMSKTYAMSGLRLGYLVAPGLPWLMSRLQKLVRCTINGVNSVTQFGAAAALNGPQETTRAMAVEYQRRRDVLLKAAVESPYIDPFAPSGAFYLWCRITPEWPGRDGQRDDWSMTNYLIDAAAIGSAPGSAFGHAGRGHIRFAFSCATAHVEKAAGLLPGVLRAAAGCPPPC